MEPPLPTHKTKKQTFNIKKTPPTVGGDLKFFVDCDFSMATGLRNRRAGEGGEEREREGKEGRPQRRE